MPGTCMGMGRFVMPGWRKGHGEVLDRDPRHAVGIDHQLVAAQTVGAGARSWLERGRRAQVGPVRCLLGAADFQLLAGVRIRENLWVVTVEGGFHHPREFGVDRHRPAGMPGGVNDHQGCRIGSGSSCHTPSMCPSDQGR